MGQSHVTPPPGTATLRDRIAGGSYRVDPGAVADAIIARHGARGDLQRLCSEMLVASQPARKSSGEGEPLAGNDAA